MYPLFKDQINYIIENTILHSMKSIFNDATNNYCRKLCLKVTVPNRIRIWIFCLFKIKKTRTHCSYSVSFLHRTTATVFYS